MQTNGADSAVCFTTALFSLCTFAFHLLLLLGNRRCPLLDQLHGLDFHRHENRQQTRYNAMRRDTPQKKIETDAIYITACCQEKGFFGFKVPRRPSTLASETCPATATAWQQSALAQLCIHYRMISYPVIFCKLVNSLILKCRYLHDLK